MADWFTPVKYEKQESEHWFEPVTKFSRLTDPLKLNGVSTQKDYSITDQQEIWNYFDNAQMYAQKYSTYTYSDIKNTIEQMQTNKRGYVRRNEAYPGEFELQWLKYYQWSGRKKILANTDKQLEDLAAKAYNLVQGKANGWYDKKTPKDYEKEYTTLKKQRDAYKREIAITENKLKSDKYVTDAKNSADFDEYVEFGAALGDKRNGFLSLSGCENEIAFYRKNFDKIPVNVYASRSIIGERVLMAQQLTDEEFDVYCYYLGKEKKGKIKVGTAEKYLYSIQDQVNQRIAKERFKQLEGNTLAEIISAVPAGLDRFSSGIKNLFSSEDYIPSSPTQHLSYMVREDLADDGPKILGSSLAQGSYDFLSSTANVLPSALISLIPYVGPTAGSIVMGASAAGNAYQSAINSGFDKTQARAYSTLIGASEGGLNYLLGGIAKMGKWSTHGVNALVGKLDNVLAKVALNYGDDIVKYLKIGAQMTGKAFSEFSEEYLQATLEPFYKNIALGEDNKIDLLSEQALYEGLLGALTSGLINISGKVLGKGLGIDDIQKQQYNKEQRGVQDGGEELLYNRGGQAGKKSADTQSRFGAVQETVGRMESDLQEVESGYAPIGDRGDTGRVALTAEQNERLRNTAIKNEDGTPQPVYHFTENMEFDTFAKGDTGFHFGNADQAAQRGRSKGQSGRVITACLNIQNPIRINADIMNWNPDTLALKLWADYNILTNEELSKIYQLARQNETSYDSPAAVELRRILAEKGYDGVVYPNGFEGDGDSYIALYPEQVITLDDGRGADGMQTGVDGAENDIILKGESYERTDEFRRLQEESKRMSDEDIQLYRSGERKIDDRLRGRFSRGVRSLFMETDDNGISYADGVLKLSSKNNNFNIYENVNGELFHDVFEMARNYLKFGELVDLHDVNTTGEGIGYTGCFNYLSEDGLSGFSITSNGDLISVFNASGKSGLLRAIAPVVKEKAKTLDCYASSLQNLQEIYESIFGFKTASIMDYNMAYDHDNIAKNHGSPQVAFMVNTDAGVETRRFTKEQYDEAKAYRDGFIENKKADAEGSAFSMPKKGILEVLKDTVSQKTGEQMEKFWDNYLDKRDKMEIDGDSDEAAEKINNREIDVVHYDSLNAINDFKPQHLMKELINSDVKYNLDDIIMLKKTDDGRLLWLEKGNNNAGLTHILERHNKDFINKGITDIPMSLFKILETKPIKMGSNKNGFFADYMVNGNKFRVAYGTNGFIVSFFPIE